MDPFADQFFIRNSGLRAWHFKPEKRSLRESAQRVFIGVVLLFAVVCVVWGMWA